MYLYQRSDPLLSRQIRILNQNTCSNFMNEDSTNIADVLQVKIQLNLIKNRQNNYILNI